MQDTGHERFDRHDDTEAGSERSFGLVFAAFCALVGAIRLWNEHGGIIWWLGAAAVFLILGLFWTAPLKPLNRLWFKLAMLLYKVVNPVVMGLLFFTTVTPIALLLRALGKDIIKLRREPEASTYWIHREPPGPLPETMTKQF